MPTVVKAAGCLVWRPLLASPDVASPESSNIEVLVVHRDRYDDWSFPKGKLDGDETEMACALREVKEETNVEGELGNELPMISYVDHKGRDKTVRYWMLRYTEGRFVPNDEVDRVLWLSPEEAATKLSYEHDVALLGHLSP